MSTMARAEHLTWCKDRALALVDSGDLDGAVGSMISDMRKHAETDMGFAGVLIGSIAIGHVQLGDTEAVRGWIVGFA